jgi:hypothetical protein
MLEGEGSTAISSRRRSELDLNLDLGLPMVSEAER